jgi:hypothetical protein
MNIRATNGINVDSEIAWASAIYDSEWKIIYAAENLIEYLYAKNS